MANYVLFMAVSERKGMGYGQTIELESTTLADALAEAKNRVGEEVPEDSEEECCVFAAVAECGEVHQIDVGF